MPQALSLRSHLEKFGHLLQSSLFPTLAENTGPLSTSAELFIAVLSMIPLRRFVPVSQGWNGRPALDRLAIAQAFVAKAVYNIPTTRMLLDRLRVDTQLRGLCGWGHVNQIPHESTFSRAFAELASMELPQFVHQALIGETQGTRLIGHIARDSTAIEARERVSAAALHRMKANATRKSLGKKKKCGRRRKGEPRPLQKVTRLQRQRSMNIDAMLAELSRDCSIGVKTNSKGIQHSWRGYKLHLDVADGQIPITALLTGASVHDSQAAIPLMTMTAQRVTALYELMDSAYDASAIHDHSRSLGHVPIIDPAARGRKTKNVIVPGKQPRQFSDAEALRYNERTMIERVNARLKDEFGGRFVRVRGAKKVMAHLMFGVIAITVDQLLRLTG